MGEEDTRKLVERVLSLHEKHISYAGELRSVPVRTHRDEWDALIDLARKAMSNEKKQTDEVNAGATTGLNTEGAETSRLNGNGAPNLANAPKEVKTFECEPPEEKLLKSTGVFICAGQDVDEVFGMKLISPIVMKATGWYAFSAYEGRPGTVVYELIEASDTEPSREEALRAKNIKNGRPSMPPGICDSKRGSECDVLYAHECCHAFGDVHTGPCRCGCHVIAQSATMRS